MRSAIDSLLLHSPAQPLLASRTRQRLGVLAYHQIEDASRFAEQVAFVAKESNPISLSDLLNAIDKPGGSLPANPTLITFDDADRTLLELGLPVLERFKVPAVAFAVAENIGTARPFWWREVEHLVRHGATTRSLGKNSDSVIRSLKRVKDSERRALIGELRRSAPGVRLEEHQLTADELRFLQHSGIDIGNHTLTHPVLDQCSDSEIRDEIARSHESLTEALRTEPIAFAYPNGNWDLRAQRLLREQGYKFAFLFDHRVSEFPPTDPFRISRLRVSTRTSMNRFRLIVSGLHPLIHHTLGRS